MNIFRCNNENYEDRPKICFITAIYGNYEATCKKFVKQTIPTDFICFTDNANTVSNGWIIDTTPYHYENKSELDDDSYWNSLSKNQHTFNIAKYYKQSFQRIPRLKDYDVIVWLDGTIEIIYDKTSEYIMSKIKDAKIIGWNHEYRNGELQSEVQASNMERYSSTFWNNQAQPIQDVNQQYIHYKNDGYTDAYFDDEKSPYKKGVWITCFVAFLQKDNDVKKFLDLWYLQTLKHTTQDQVSFSYVCQKTHLVPFTLPNDEITGMPHDKTTFYIKHGHNK
jgi:hypothetical protein